MNMCSCGNYGGKELGAFDENGNKIYVCSECLTDAMVMGTNTDDLASCDND